MLLLSWARVVPEAPAERDTVAGKLIEAVSRHAVFLFALLVWGHVVFLEGLPISPRARGVLRRSLQVRLELRRRIEASRAVIGGLLHNRGWLRGFDLETHVVDGLSDYHQNFFLLDHELLKPWVIGGRRANIPLENHECYHEKRPSEECDFQRGQAPSHKPHVDSTAVKTHKHKGDVRQNTFKTHTYITPT